MARAPQPSKFLSVGEIDNLRAMILHLRDDLHISREEIVSTARVSATDIDNFLGRKGRGVFKAQVPREQFQRRMLAYVLSTNIFRAPSYHPTSDDIRVEFDPREDPPGSPTADQLKRFSLGSYWEDFNRQFGSALGVTGGSERARSLYKFDSQDTMFQLLSSLDLATERSCRSLCEKLSGSYYTYRYSSTRNAVMRSYVEIARFDPYEKTPQYTSKFHEANNVIRISEGSVFEIGRKYVLLGLTRIERGRHRSNLGLNLTILHNADLFRPNALSGLYLSCDPTGNYNVGNVKFIATDDKYNHENIGEAIDLPKEVSREELAMDILDIAELLATPFNKELLEQGKIARSFKFYARRPRRGK